MNTKITFSGAPEHPVTSYNKFVGPALKILGLAISRMNTTEGSEEWLDLKELAELVKAKLPSNIKRYATDDSIKERLKVLDSQELMDITRVVEDIANQLHPNKKS